MASGLVPRVMQTERRESVIEGWGKSKKECLSIVLKLSHSFTGYSVTCFYLNREPIPMADPLTPAISDRICKHMNEDHAAAIALYAQVFGDRPGTETAQLLAIDPQGMDLSIQEKGTTETLRIEFDHVLQNSEDAHQTLIAMARQARKN